MLTRLLHRGFFLVLCAVGTLGATETRADYVVGSVVAQQGAAAISGAEFLRGAAAMIDSVNAKGGVGGQKIKLVTGDDGIATGSDPSKTVSEFNRVLKESSPIAFVNASGTPNMEALLKDGTVTRAGVPVVGPFSLSNALRTRGEEHMFFVRTGSKEESYRMVQQAHSMGMTRLALVYVDNNFGKELNALAREHLAAHPEITVHTHVLPSTNPDVDTVVKEILAKQTQMIFLLIPGRMVPTVVKAYCNQGGAGFMVTSSAASADQIAATLGPDLARGIGVMQVVPSVTRKDIPVVRDFHAAMNASHKTWQPTAYALEGYINARIVVEGLKRMNGTRPADLSKALRTLKGLDLGGLVVDLSAPKRSGLRFVDIGVIGHDGKLRM